MPQFAPLHPAPSKRQVTAWLKLLTTVAVNCCVCPTRTFAVVGEMDITVGGITVTVDVSNFVLSAFEVAVTVTVGGVGTVAGAV